MNSALFKVVFRLCWKQEKLKHTQFVYLCRLQKSAAGAKSRELRHWHSHVKTFRRVSKLDQNVERFAIFFFSHFRFIFGYILFR